MRETGERSSQPAPHWIFALRWSIYINNIVGCSVINKGECIETCLRAVVLLCIVALPADAAKWLRLPQHDDTEIYVDVASVSRHDKLMHAWDRTDYPSPQTAIFAPFERYRSMKALGYYDCAKKKAALRELVLYAGPQLSGKVVADIKVPRAHLAFEPEAEGTVGGALLKYVCRRWRNARSPKHQNERE